MLTHSDTVDLKAAKLLLENPGLAAKLGNTIGSPIEATLKRLPASVNAKINDVTKASIEKALDIAILTMGKEEKSKPSNWWHKVAVGASGAAGGALGLPALAIELPVSTTIMLRSIADIARSEGEDLSSPDARLQCVQVLALGGPSQRDDGVESGYFAARAALAKTISEAAAHLARHGLSQQGAPVLVRLISQVASRFSVVVTEKLAAQAVPLVGAIGGATLNTLFIDHFQDMGRGHFVVRRLERLYGADAVREAYESL